MKSSQIEAIRHELRKKASRSNNPKQKRELFHEAADRMEIDNDGNNPS